VTKQFTFRPALPTRVVIIVVVVVVVVVVVILVVVVAVVVVAVIVVVIVDAPFLSPRLLRSVPTHHEPAG
jgi:hypothetical protein